MPLRSFGSMPIALRYKEHFSPCLEALGTATWHPLGYRSILVDAAAEVAVMEVRLPLTALNVGRLRIHFFDNNANVGGIYNFQLDLINYRVDAGWTLFLSAPQQYDVVTGVDDFELDLLPYAFTQGDILNIQVSYAAAGGGGLATDCYVIGAVLLEN